MVLRANPVSRTILLIEYPLISNCRMSLSCSTLIDFAAMSTLIRRQMTDKAIRSISLKGGSTYAGMTGPQRGSICRNDTHLLLIPTQKPGGQFARNRGVTLKRNRGVKMERNLQRSTSNDFWLCTSAVKNTPNKNTIQGLKNLCLENGFMNEYKSNHSQASGPEKLLRPTWLVMNGITLVLGVLFWCGMEMRSG